MRVSIIMGSISDREIADAIVKQLKEFGIDYDAKVISAHRAHAHLEEYVKDAEKYTAVFISIAGKAAHLGGVIAALTTRPVIGVPCKSSTLGGLEALLSTVEMPSGVPVATVAINGGKNAAILACEIMAISDENLSKKLKDFRAKMEEEIKNTEYIYEG